MPPSTKFAVPASTEWQTQGCCQKIDADVFFPPIHSERKAERDAREHRAIAVCKTCPVIEECLEWALTTREPHGVWGGCGEAERRRMLKENQLPISA